ncbi:MAG: hypothetical protein Q8O41_06360 [Candidatus Methanoperedens sp.]|nr:hypothetical protein [Candidatus Methanoperedens sp.]
MRSPLPTEPDNTAGRMGRTHGVITVAMPAMKTISTFNNSVKEEIKRQKNKGGF